ncbi:MAG: hypothetical protein AAGG02_16605 [Cyanobacteria bacterium P01_H01_bin.15]
MLTKLLALIALIVVILAILVAFTQPTAFQIRRQHQPFFLSRYGMRPTGRYEGNRWLRQSGRGDFGSFRGGGPSAGK